MDKTKYNLNITKDGGITDYQSLDKVKAAFKIIEYFLDSGLESKEDINSHNFINYTLLLNEKELLEKTPNIQGRYKKSLPQHDLFFSRMWDKEQLEGLIQYVKDNYPNIFAINVSSEMKYNNKTKKNMNIPLNQIFYGPPGTGKTFVMSSKSKEIIQNNFKDNISSPIGEFNRIVTFIRANFNDKDHNVQNGKNLYRNLSRILNIWGYILDAEFENVDILDNDRVKLKGSNWPQHYRYVTHFGFVDDWRDGRKIKLNSKGKNFKIKIKNWLNKNTDLYKSVTPDFDVKHLSEQDILIKKGFQFLRTHDDPGENLPDIFIEEYKSAIINNPTEEGVSGFIKSIYCALFMAIKGTLYGHKSAGKLKTQVEEDLIQEYFDLNEKTKNKGELRDLEWIGWITKNLEELHLIEIHKTDELNNYFKLTKAGLELVNSIIGKWKEETPSIFEVISFESGVKLGFIEFITFHQSYSYEEFIEGIRPNLDGKNDLTYSIEKGVFKRISDRAKNDQANKYVIIIDEINRGNISKIFEI